MQILNFAHPLTEAQLAGIEDLAGVKITGVTEIPSQIDPDKAIEPQIEAMLDYTGLTPQDWQTKPLLINLPSLNYSTAALLAQLHGRTGYFPRFCGCARSPKRSLPASRPWKFLTCRPCASGPGGEGNDLKDNLIS